MSNSAIQRLIESATHQDTVDLKAICQSLHIRVVLDEQLQDYCKIGIDVDEKLTIWLNTKIDKKTKFTFVAIATAEWLIHPDRVKDQGVSYDIFFLRELTNYKASKLIMLATRLAVPEHIIEKLSDALEVQFTKNDAADNFDSDAYIENSDYLPEFLRCVIKVSSSIFLLDNLSSKFE
ncbi:hypothetical protein tinsulaeT_03520 [Thalassotalea insulae]|uniref:Uncharacterized protein n=1 Tax=Thalassotalea insulae TaxID=2056778 RepID=A0ABQ6GR28_9GAMM|nr:hypothetical protein [Thalassotalea insulae]GLX77012.1 hypothetical protein tinsulaeT_03520 [Thalassotalea insulae]